MVSVSALIAGNEDKHFLIKYPLWTHRLWQAGL